MIMTMTAKSAPYPGYFGNVLPAGFSQAFALVDSFLLSIRIQHVYTVCIHGTVKAPTLSLAPLKDFPPRHSRMALGGAG